MAFDIPDNAPIADADGQATPSWRSWLSWVHATTSAARQAGATSDRPVKFIWIGRRYFDNTLGKPVYLKSVNPNVWVDGAGTIS